MEDFYFAGGLRALLAQLDCGILHRFRTRRAVKITAVRVSVLHSAAMTVNGRTLGENIAGAKIFNPEVIRPRDNPLSAEGGTAMLRGNLCPHGAVIKHSAMEPRFLRHDGTGGRLQELRRSRGAPRRSCAADHCRTASWFCKVPDPSARPACRSGECCRFRRRLLEAGVRDLLRISDARMSGTSYGACVLHVAPESAIGGPLALVRDGDLITLDVPARTLTLEVSDEELAARKAAWKQGPRPVERGYLSLFLNEVTQADEGCDFRFLHAGTADTGTSDSLNSHENHVRHSRSP